jgi:hypothetical protein
LNLFWKGKPLHSREKIYASGEKVHYAEIAVNICIDIWVEDFDCHGSRRDGRKRILKNYGTEGTFDSARAKIGRRDEVVVQDGIVNLKKDYFR